MHLAFIAFVCTSVLRIGNVLMPIVIFYFVAYQNPKNKPFNEKQIFREHVVGMQQDFLKVYKQKLREYVRTSI